MKVKFLKGLFLSGLLATSLFSCSKDEVTSTDVPKIAENEFVGAWDKQDTVRISFSKDGKFTAQRWISDDKSYANNFAVEGNYTVNNNEVTINVSESNLTHLWSEQKLEKIILSTQLSSDKKSVKVKSVSIFPNTLDVKDAVIKRLGNAFSKNDSPTTVLPNEKLQLKDVTTYTPTTLPNIKPWTYTNQEFNFTLKNYELGIATPDQATVNLPFSTMGQHLHLIVDDAPYLPVMNIPFKNNLTDGEHTIVIGAGRSYHELYKNPEAIITSKIMVMGGSEVAGSRTPITTPEIFASRPKGNYNAADAKRILIDYVLTETAKANLDAKKQIVRITVDHTPFINNKWKANVLEGLSRLGTHKLRLDLYDLEAKKIIMTKKSEFTLQ
ncbi:hypothetical protein [Flavobacterium sp.]|uniref:hypothetical protein n=1 Tax=Flavobacterium sp. TaxID=239 RepID=UPI003D122272